MRTRPALRPGAPLAFTHHHDELEACAAIRVAILDAGLACSASIPRPAEMGGLIHIAGTGSSIVATAFVCRSTGTTARSGLFEGAEVRRGHGRAWHPPAGPCRAGRRHGSPGAAFPIARPVRREESRDRAKRRPRRSRNRARPRPGRAPGALDAHAGPGGPAHVAPGARVETACLTPSQGADADADSSSTGSTKWTPPPGWEGPTRSSSTSGSRNGPSQGNGFWCRGTWARSWKTQRPASLAARLQGAPQRHAAPPRCDRRRGLTLAPMDWPVPTTRQRGFVSRPRQQPDPGP